MKQDMYMNQTNDPITHFMGKEGISSFDKVDQEDLESYIMDLQGELSDVEEDIQYYDSAKVKLSRDAFRKDSVGEYYYQKTKRDLEQQHKTVVFHTGIYG